MYDLLKQTLSRYILAVTVDDPASLPPTPMETLEADNAADKSDATGDATEAGNGAGDESRGASADNTEGDGGSVADATGSRPAPPVAKVDPNGPKCVQLKMKPDWRKGGKKRRRGDLDKGGGSGGRGSWPADRPEFCRFVLYKENSDTVRDATQRRRFGK